MTDLNPWYAAREIMVDALVADLHGSEDDELLTENPLRRFLVGILHPRSGDAVEVDRVGDDADQDAGTAPDADFDPGVSFSHMRYPSTIGLTAGIKRGTTGIQVSVQTDRYEEVDEGESKLWKRRPFGPFEVDISTSAPAVGETLLCEGLALRHVVRAPHDGVQSVTLVLVNTLASPTEGGRDRHCWFRPSIVVRTLDGEFVDRRPEHLLEHMDADALSAELLHRAQRHLAVGHGVAVDWQETVSVRAIRTTFFPRHDLPLAEASRPDLSAIAMTELADGSLSPLHGLVDAYETWITDKEVRDVPSLSGVHLETAQRHLNEARGAAHRMRRGIGIIESEPLVGRSFRVMNAVMQMQREHQEMLRGVLDTPGTPVVGEWRPFQMAFILMNIEGLSDPGSDERDLADVLWFPTGGGKTEAYLGLIALAMVHRRLRGAGADGRGAGVAVIMRYTLRLLTLQQFERAAGLICALEVWRRAEPDMQEKEPFTIGLWVGQGATPNSIADAAKALRRRRGNDDPGDLGDPVQLLRCPWCGSRLTEDHYEVDRRANRLTVRCPGTDCVFRLGDGLPVALVDSDVYSVRPSLVIGTVDKFAMLAWRGEAGSLFGRGTDAPPDLVVQDELHLISGPLGTLVGLYETAIDHLATDRTTGTRPKVIASTATIRRAKEQVRSVFAREARQFPPPGIDASDSFFAVDAPRESKGTRLYVGVMAPGTSHATLTVRTYAALLQAALASEMDDAVRDAYWTLLGYFNSLRVLGAAFIATIDDVRDRIKVVAGRREEVPRVTRDPRELTSRKKSSEIPVELEALQTAYPSPLSPDTVLATNMISVGVDVDRLGLMVVSGQPQTTSEYIQATSRVGRRHPGLVVTLFNAGRSRDLSHYEAFTTYHRSLYQQVEATGATPFASRALDRGLHGLLAVLARHLVPGAASDDAAVVPVQGGRKDLDAVSQTILDRVRSVSPDAEEDVEDALEALIGAWEDAVASGEVTKYAGWRSSLDALLVPAGASLSDELGEPLTEIFPPGRPAWATLTSLRNVDRECSLRLVSAQRRARRDEK
ncbi:hypothetical protein N802_06885 [Knoellia sinensis KCTC 19936]|uniref:Helicase C-terminal domain-containing protein n=1 Tax=Knoellia sinensis KCTC 19936 TaxID=1385520 RepID=A0A0A0J4L3_9MICO|nr:helicase-related protein [Knoellia sinensis]KGN30536.1 hypothetical protein N802_06885 [Knoellia sinensis KCTC 19936]